MTATLESLNRLPKTSSSLFQTPLPVSMEAEPVKKQMQVLAEMTFIYVLKLLGVEDEKTLAELVSRLREGTPFYDFTFLAHNLAKSRTDFDFLTSPENLTAYAKIAEVSRDCDVQLLPYVNVLARIAENKQYGLYSENQEVTFFLDEYGKHKDSVDAKEFLHQFKKILKYETQKIFERFINDRIFSIIQHTLVDYSSKISTEQMLSIYVYGLWYYKCDISNADENFLIEHIRFCVNNLSSHDEILFKPIITKKIFPKFTGEKDSLHYFFSHNSESLGSLERFCALLKDVCPTEEAIDFCDFLKANLNRQGQAKIYEDKNDFTHLISRMIREKAETMQIPLYKEICQLLPVRIICERSPHLLQHGGHSYFHFFDTNERFLFYASEDGNKNKKIPEAHVPIELEILKKDSDGRVSAWNWHEI